MSALTWPVRSFRGGDEDVGKEKRDRRLTPLLFRLGAVTACARCIPACRRIYALASGLPLSGGGGRGIDNDRERCYAAFPPRRIPRPSHSLRRGVERASRRHLLELDLPRSFSQSSVLRDAQRYDGIGMPWRGRDDTFRIVRRVAGLLVVGRRRSEPGCCRRRVTEYVRAV